MRLHGSSSKSSSSGFSRLSRACARRWWCLRRGRDQRVRFGATVTVREPDGGESSYRIVGVDETDLDRGWVSWLSPIAKALLNAEPGQRVRLKLPAGDVELEVTGVSPD